MKKFLPNFLITFIAGSLYALAYPTALSSGIFPLLFLALPLFLWKLETSSFKQSLLYILCFNLGLNITGYYWIPHTLREFGELPYIVSVLLGSFFALILQPHWWFYALWRKFRPVWKWDSSVGILITALIMTLLERFIPQQFPSFVGSPWLHLAPYLGLAPIFGVVGFSLMTYWVSLEALSQIKTRSLRPLPWMSFGIFILANILMPLKNIESGKSLPVRVVQANIGNFLKVSSERGDSNSYESIMRNYYRQSTDESFKPDLIIWPETAYPNTFYGEETVLDRLFVDIIKATNAEMLIGGYNHNMKKSPGDFIESVYNASILISGDSVKTSYHKNILIPFGETLPFGPLNKTIVEIVPTISLFARGEGTPLMETKNGFRFVTPICYELLESNYMRSLLNEFKGNHFIVNHTNDSWYGDTAEPYQHLFLGKWRALEFQLPIIRSTNTGITSVIYPDGSESKQLKINETANLDLNVNLGSGKETPYQLYGAFPMLGLFVILLLVSFLLTKIGSRP